jgi:hypothetical protein
MATPDHYACVLRYSPDGGIGYTLQRGILAWGEARARNNIRRICDEEQRRPTPKVLPRGRSVWLLAALLVSHRSCSDCSFLAPARSQTDATDLYLSRRLVYTPHEIVS